MNVHKLNDRLCVLRCRLPRWQFDALTSHYPNEWQALRALRLLFEDAVAIAVADAPGCAQRREPLRAPDALTEPEHTP